MLQKRELRSNVLLNGQAAAPTDSGYVTGDPSQPNPNRNGLPYLEIGEIALNYASGDPAIFIRKDDDTLAKFTPASGVKIVDTIADLPPLQPVPPRAGDTYFVKFNADRSQLIWRCYVFDPSIPPAGGWAIEGIQKHLIKALHTDDDFTDVGPAAVGLTPGDLQICIEDNFEQIDVWAGTSGWQTIFSLQDLVERIPGLHFVSRISALPTPILGQLSIPDGTGLIVRTDLSGANELNRLLVWHETQEEGAIPGVEQQGFWVSVNPEVYVNALRTQPLPADSVSNGDITVVLERDHEQLWCYDEGGQAWQLIYSRDQVAEMIAKASLFESVAINDGHDLAGSLEFHELPDLTSADPAVIAANVGKIAHYWVFSGAPRYVVRNDAHAGTTGIATIGNAPATLTPAPAAAIHEENVYPKRAAGGTSQGGGAAFTVDIDTTGALTLAITNAGRDYEVGDTIEFALGGLTFTARVATLGPATGDPHGIGADLNSVALNPGDWLIVSNRGDATHPDLHWSVVTGDLLSKARADALFGWHAWTAGSYEAGSIVVYQGTPYRAKQPIAAADPHPGPTLVTIPVAAAAAADQFPDALNVNWPPAPAAGDWVEATGAFTVPVGGGIFEGRALNTGDKMLFCGDATITGTLSNGLHVDHGWILYPDPMPLPTVAQVGQLPNSKWEKIDLAGGIRTIADDSGLPAAPVNGELVFVITSAHQGGKPSFLMYDAGAGKWVVVGGGSGGIPLKLSGGGVIMEVGVPVGTVITFAGKTVPMGYLLCDGAQFDVAKFWQLWQVLQSDRTPDLRGQFIMGGATADAYTKHPWQTGMPRNAFAATTDPSAAQTVDTTAENRHTHQVFSTQDRHSSPNNVGNQANGANWSVAFMSSGGEYQGSVAFTPEHKHRVTVPAHTHALHVTGGDARTVPDHVVLAYLIRAVDRAGFLTPF